MSNAVGSGWGGRVVRGPMSAQISRLLAEFIEEHGLAPGDVLPAEHRLAKEFGVSRPVVREALRALAGRDVVEIVNGKGAVVRPMDASTLSAFFERAVKTEDDAVVGLMEVRKPLEAQSARLAAERRTDEEAGRMARIVSSMSERLEDPEAYANLDVAFHLLVAEATRNKMLHRLIASIRGSMKDAVLEGLLRRQTPGRLERVQELHEEVLSGIERRDPDAAAEAMTAHFDDAVTALIGDGPKSRAGG